MQATEQNNALLPTGRRMMRFDQMAEKNITDPEANVERYVGLEHLDPESLKIRRWGKPDDVEATKLLFQPGDIIFGKRRFYQRKLAVANSNTKALSFTRTATSSNVALSRRKPSKPIALE